MQDGAGGEGLGATPLGAGKTDSLTRERGAEDHHAPHVQEGLMTTLTPTGGVGSAHFLVSSPCMTESKHALYFPWIFPRFATVFSIFFTRYETSFFLRPCLELLLLVFLRFLECIFSIKLDQHRPCPWSSVGPLLVFASNLKTLLSLR